MLLTGPRSTRESAPVARLTVTATCCFALTVLAALSSPLPAQSVPRDLYIRHVGSTPRIVSQARASASLHLYGDTAAPGYIDRSPADGIDDRRADRLMEIAARFSPILRRNSFVVPRDIPWVIGNRPLLQSHRWSDDRFVDSTSFVLTDNDARLLALLREFNPHRRDAATVAPGARTSQVLFVDTPGDGESSWRAAYQNRSHTGSKVYAHFFVHEDTLATPERRYFLAIQYWFFYPFNDGGNNHEGDWEHMNVLVTTRAAAIDTSAGYARAGYVSAPAIGAMLDATTPADSLVIGMVDYYFHHNVLTVDYREALVPHDRHRRAPVNDSVTPLWEDHGYVRDVVHYRLEAHGGSIATHPIGYIGGNNKGPDEVGHLIPLFRRSYNRTSGATYPFPGTWQTIGPLGATETVWGTIVPDVERSTPADSTAGSVPRVKGADYVTYGRGDILLLPDWERVLPLVMRDSLSRREWAWMILPVRWGYPATLSPGAGIVPHTDLGNNAPFGPAFKMSWNVAGPDRDHPAYQFRALRTPMSPRVAWSIVQSGWGVLNVPLILTQIYPFYNMAGAHLSPLSLRVAGRFGVHFPKTFVASPLERIASVGVGMSHQFGGEAFARAMLPIALRGNADFARLRSAERRRGDERISARPSTVPRFLLDLHIGKSIFLENSFTLGESRVRYGATDDSTAGHVTLDGTLYLRQLTGGLRKPIPWKRWVDHELFGRLGTGWAWYTLRDVRVSGASVGESMKGGYAPTLLPSRRSWPNFVYSGLAYEYFSPRPRWIAGTLGYGLRLDATWILQRLPAGEIGARRDLYFGRGDVGIKATIGW